MQLTLKSEYDFGVGTSLKVEGQKQGSKVENFPIRLPPVKIKYLNDSVFKMIQHILSKISSQRCSCVFPPWNYSVPMTQNQQPGFHTSQPRNPILSIGGMGIYILA